MASPPASPQEPRKTSATTSAQQSMPRATVNLDALLKLHLDKDIDASSDAARKRPELPPGSSDCVDPDPWLKFAHCVFRSPTNDARIYIGSKQAVTPNVADALERLHIRGIVNCTNNLPSCHRPNVRYCRVAVWDVDTASISDYFAGATAFCHHFVVRGESVLVHCQHGVSRSATIALAYLMRYQGFSRDEAYVHVKQRRPQAFPNHGFWKQLGAYETELKRTEHPEPSSLVGEMLPAEANATKTILEKSILIFLTCREVPELLDEGCWGWLEQQQPQQCHGERDSVLNAALDCVWGRGLADHDLEWFRCLCEKLGPVPLEGHASSDTQHRVLELANDPTSEFCQRWAGEITAFQIQKVERFLSSPKELRR